MDADLNNQWQNLKETWQSARKAAEDGQRQIDDLVERHLGEGGPAPTKQMRLHVEDLFYQECEARGALDLFIEENCG